jgi:3-deoxy-D-manno-octulosonic-acid transferase
LHNTLEPVVFGLPVIFGPKHSKFPEAQIFIDKSIGYTIESKLDFEEALQKIEKSWDLIRSNCEKIINESSGASIRIIDALPSRSL